MYDDSNPFLSGNYAPWREEGDAPDLEVLGELPRDLNGSLYRIGPNPHFPPLGRYHWFDGDGMVHAFTFHDGRASYRNRYVRTDGLCAEMKAGHALWGGLLNMSAETPANEPPFKNAANTNIIGYANRLLALWEAGLPHELKPLTLETVGMYNFCGKLNGPMTAHPKFDPETGDLLFFGYQPIPPYVTYYRADSNGNLMETVPIDLGLPVMMHDFVTTDKSIVFFVCPSVFRLENIAAGKPPIQWEPQHGTRIGVMDRKSHALKWFSTDACYIFHFLNAFEDAGNLIIDACRFDSIDMTGNDFGPPSFANRFTIDLAGGLVKRDQFDEHPGDFPRIDDRRAGLKHRFGYFAGGDVTLQKKRAPFSALLKRDYQTGRTETLDLGDHMTPGEPVFVPRMGGSAEDDGYVLAVWYDAQRNISEVTVIDPRHFAGEPIARVRANHRVPFGFHGNWVPASA